MDSPYEWAMNHEISVRRYLLYSLALPLIPLFGTLLYSRTLLLKLVLFTYLSYFFFSLFGAFLLILMKPRRVRKERALSCFFVASLPIYASSFFIWVPHVGIIALVLSISYFIHFSRYSFEKIFKVRRNRAYFASFLYSLILFSIFGVIWLSFLNL